MKFDNIKNDIERRISTNFFAGANAAVYRHGKLVYEVNCGFSSLESKERLKGNSIFRLASMTKPITALAVLICQDRGLLHISDKIAKFLPEYKSLKLAGGVFSMVEITLKDLLSHSSGLGSGEVGACGFDKYKPLAGQGLGDAVSAYRNIALEFEPGSMTSYSPVIAFDVLARIVEIASGEKYDDFLKVNIFDKIGMDDTAYLLNDEQKTRLVQMYDLKNGKLHLYDMGDTGFEAFPPGYTGGGAGLFSTIGDYAKFLQLLTGMGKYNGIEVLSAEACSQMYTQTLPESVVKEDSATWGLGVYVRLKNHRLPKNSYGWSGAYGTHFWIDDSNGIFAIYMANQRNAGGSCAPTITEFEDAVMRGIES